MIDWLTALWTTEGFMPHGHCYLWKPELLWMHVISDSIIFLSYSTIPIFLALFIRKRKDLPFSWIFTLFSIFIIACGLTHLLAIVTVWHPTYWLTGYVKVLTAIASLLTAISLFPLLPRALAIPSPTMLRTANEELSKQIVERKKIESEINVKNTELQRVNTALNESIDNLKMAQEQMVTQEKMASLGRLVAGVAHEINTPIGIGVTAASYLSELSQELSEKFNENNLTRNFFSRYVEKLEQCSLLISSNLARSAELVDSFKHVAVDQTSKNLRLFDIKCYFNEVLMNLHPELKNTPYKVNLECAENINIYGEPGALAQVLTNLIMNSLKHGFEDAKSGNIDIKVNHIDDSVLVIYKDSGKGISYEHLQQIYEPFFTTKRGQGGSGLGMHLVYNLVTQSLKGSIKCDSTLGQGTQFTISFPCDLRT